MSKYNDYFSSLSLNEQDVAKAEQAVTLFEELYGPYRFETAFISMTADEHHLWLFADDLIGVAKNFSTNETAISFEASVFAKKVTSWMLSKDNFTINQAAMADSTLTVNFSLATGASNTLRATGENCTELASILERYILPNMPE